MDRITGWKLTEKPSYGNVTGYGPRQPVGAMVRLEGEGRWRRVYCAVYSNAGSCYYVKAGERVFFSDCDLPSTECTVAQ